MPGDVALPVAAGLVAGIAFVIMFSLLATNLPAEKTVSIRSTFGPQELLEEGKGVITISSVKQQVNATRGSTVAIPLTVTYITNSTGAANDKEITLVYDGISGIAYAGKDHLLLDRSSLVAMRPPSVAISPGESKMLEMLVVIPSDWPDEAVGDIDFSPTFKMAKDNPDAAVFTTSVSVSIE